jgi:hypothetical protein
MTAPCTYRAGRSPFLRLRHHHPARRRVLRQLHHEGARTACAEFGITRGWGADGPRSGWRAATPRAGRPVTSWRASARAHPAGPADRRAYRAAGHGGSPGPHAMPAPSLLTHRLDILAIPGILSAVVWLAWLPLVVCRSPGEGGGAEHRNAALVPLAMASSTVHRLVTAARCCSAPPPRSPAFTHQALGSRLSPPPRSGAAGRPRRPPRRLTRYRAGRGGRAGRTGRAVYRGGLAGPRAARQALEPAHHRVRRTERSMVQPPEGRYHEACGSRRTTSAMVTLPGDLQLNRGPAQPDGSKLTIAA